MLYSRIYFDPLLVVRSNNLFYKIIVNLSFHEQNGF